MSMFATLARHTRNYSIASVLTTVAGLISFPILTRVLSVEDYGLMNLIAAALAFAVGVGKLGMQHATLRFHADVAADKVVGARLDEFVPTVLWGMGLLGLLATLAWLLVAGRVPASFWADARMGPLMQLTAVLVLVRVLSSGVGNLLRAREHSGLLAVLGVLQRYASLSLVLAAVFLVAPTLWSFFGATVVAEVLLLGVTAVLALRGASMRLRQVNPALLRQMVVFALPMTGYELASVVLQLGDRYVQQAHLDVQAVGLYSAAYNLCDYVRLALFTAMSAAALPMVLRLHAEDGAAATEAFLARFAHLYLAGGLCVVALLCAVRFDLLSLLASPKYLPGAAVIPWLIVGMLCEAYFVMAGVGLYLAKRSIVTMGILAAGAALNILLNLWWVPLAGIKGSAMANLASCLAIVVAAQWASARHLRMPLPLAALLKFGAIAAVSWATMDRIDTGQPLPNLLLRGGVGVLLYLALAWGSDAVVRELARSAGLKLRLKLGARWA